MNSQAAYEWVVRERIIAGTRGNFTVDIALKVAAVLIEEGINTFELTMNSTTPIEAMQAIKREYGDAACVGMGTVLSVDMAKQVLDAGADFVVSPAFQPAVVQTVLDGGVFVAPGVMTPSEAVGAWDMGVKMLKIFPIGVLGLDYFKAVFGPLDHMKFMCNGGMTAENASSFIKAGASACGMAGWLTGSGDLPLETIRERARLLRQNVPAIQAV